MLDGLLEMPEWCGRAGFSLNQVQLHSSDIKHIATKFNLPLCHVDLFLIDFDFQMLLLGLSVAQWAKAQFVHSLSHAIGNSIAGANIIAYVQRSMLTRDNWLFPCQGS